MRQNKCKTKFDNLEECYYFKEIDQLVKDMFSWHQEYEEKSRSENVLNKSHTESINVQYRDKRTVEKSAACSYENNIDKDCHGNGEWVKLRVPYDTNTLSNGEIEEANKQSKRVIFEYFV